jgi:hypothetical protein
MLRPVRSRWIACGTTRAFLAAAALLGATPPANAGDTLDTLKQVQLLSDAITDYYGDVMRDAALLELQRNNVKVLEATLRQMRDRFVAGEVTRIDLARVESSLAAQAPRCVRLKLNSPLQGRIISKRSRLSGTTCRRARLFLRCRRPQTPNNRRTVELVRADLVIDGSPPQISLPPSTASTAPVTNSASSSSGDSVVIWLGQPPGCFKGAIVKQSGVCGSASQIAEAPN